MVDEIIKEIKLAEDKADEIQKNAYQQGKDIVLNAENEVDKLKKATIFECKQNQKKALADAEGQAAIKREQILKKGAEDADKLIDDKNAAVEEKADEIVKLLLDKYTA